MIETCRHGGEGLAKLLDKSHQKFVTEVYTDEVFSTEGKGAGMEQKSNSSSSISSGGRAGKRPKSVLYNKLKE